MAPLRFNTRSTVSAYEFLPLKQSLKKMNSWFPVTKTEILQSFISNNKGKILWGWILAKRERAPGEE